jgi:hypothetical protein
VGAAGGAPHPPPPRPPRRATPPQSPPARRAARKSASFSPAAILRSGSTSFQAAIIADGLSTILLRALALLLALAAPAARDLSVDEAMGGHTLARHVGKTDADLSERLRREPQISSASTYTDRATAERVVGAALASGGRGFEAWRARTGRRPNFVLRYADSATIGRSMSRGRSASAPCTRALVVLRWDDRRQRFYVLTSYPEVTR